MNRKKMKHIQIIYSLKVENIIIKKKGLKKYYYIDNIRMNI